MFTFMNAAASSSAVPPISPMRMIPEIQIDMLIRDTSKSSPFLKMILIKYKWAIKLEAEWKKMKVHRYEGR